MNSTHTEDTVNEEEAETSSLEPRKHDHCRSNNDCNMDKMKIFSGQSVWPSHVESIQDEWQTLQDQIHQAQLQECNYHAAPETFRCSSSSSSSSEHEEWRLKICEWMFAIVDFYGLHREVATMAMDFIDRSFHQPRVRRTLWSSIQQEKLHASSSQSPWLSVKEDSTQFYRWVAITSLFLAVKLVSPLRLYIGTFCQLVPGKTLRPGDLFTMERHLLQALHWQLHPPTALSYVTLYLRYLLLTFYKTSTSTTSTSTTTTINLTSEEANQGDTSMVDDDEKELNDALVWQGMVSSCETIAETAQYLTEAMVFLNTPWRKQSTTTHYKTSVWAMAAIWCALELYQVQNHCDNERDDDNDESYYTLWQDLIWHYLLPLLDLKWNQVQEVCRLLRPILSIQLAASEHDEEQAMIVTEMEFPLETSLCDETHRFGGGKTSPTSVLENGAEQHFGEDRKKKEACKVNISLQSSTPDSSVQNATIPTTAWGPKREAMIRLMLDSKRQKLVTEATVVSSNPPNEANQHDVGEEWTNSEFKEKCFGRLVTSHTKRNTQTTITAALFAERYLAESQHQGGRLGQHQAINISRDECQIADVATKLSYLYPAHNDTTVAGAGRAFSTLCRPIPRRAPASDDLVGNEDSTGQANLA